MIRWASGTGVWNGIPTKELYLKCRALYTVVMSLFSLPVIVGKTTHARGRTNERVYTHTHYFLSYLIDTWWSHQTRHPQVRRSSPPDAHLPPWMFQSDRFLKVNSSVVGSDNEDVKSTCRRSEDRWGKSRSGGGRTGQRSSSGSGLSHDSGRKAAGVICGGPEGERNDWVSPYSPPAPSIPTFK